jgi:hypothetical protein
MTMADGTTPTPWHLWAVGALTLLWNAIGGYDYIMTQTENPDYMKMFTEEQRTFFTSFPVWYSAVWAFGVWGAVAGSILLLLRSRLAGYAFGVSLACIAISMVYTLVLTDGARIMQNLGVAMSFAVLAVGAVSFAYAFWMRRRGSLR